MRAAVLSLVAVDAALGVLIVAIVRALHVANGAAMIAVACVIVGSAWHVLAPGWVLPGAPIGLHALRLRVACGFQALLVALIVLVALLLAMIVLGTVIPIAALALAAGAPVLVVAIVSLGAAWAQAGDPRTRRAAVPVGQAERAAVLGALLAWAPPFLMAVLFAVDRWLPPGVAEALLALWAVAAGALPLNTLVVRHLARAEMLARPVVIARRATMIFGPLCLLSLVLFAGAGP